MTNKNPSPPGGLEETKDGSSIAGNVAVLDFSGDSPESPVPSPQEGKPYDPRPHEDGARRTIAYLLIGLLWLIVAALLVLLAFGSIEVVDVKEFAVVLGPVVTLVSAATGFYYGTKTHVPTGG
jgi:hypothetical protein